MRLKPVLFDILVLAALIPIVVLLFKIIPSKQHAALVAGTLFILVPLGLLIRRFRRPLKSEWAMVVWWAGVQVFWLGFAWPIFLARVIYWNMDFASLNIGGWPATTWHEYSNKAYTLMLIAIILAGFIESFAVSKKQKAA